MGWSSYASVGAPLGRDAFDGTGNMGRSIAPRGRAYRGMFKGRLSHHSATPMPTRQVNAT